MRILIAGCGDTGTALGLLLAAEGHEVWGLRRRPEGLPRALRPLAADLADPESLRAVPGGVDGVVYLASADRGDEGAYRRAYVEGVAHLLARLARDSQPRRVLFASSTAVYGQQDGGWVDEDSPTEPRHFSGRVLLEGEGRVRAAPWRSVVVRLGGIYGPGRTGLLERVRRGEASVAPGPPRYTNRIHRDDVAGVLRHLLHLPEPPPRLLGVDCDPAPEAEVLAWLAARLGAPPPGVAAEAPAGRRARGNRRASNRRLLATGYGFRWPTFREGYGALLAGGGAD